MCTNCYNEPNLHIKVPIILLIAFCGKFCSFCNLIMPKLLSRSKHEEFKSNSTLQIKDQNDRRAKCEENWNLQECFFHSHCAACEHCSSCCLFPCFFTPQFFATIFGFSPFYPCFIHLCLDWIVFHLVCKAT